MSAFVPEHQKLYSGASLEEYKQRMAGKPKFAGASLDDYKRRYAADITESRLSVGGIHIQDMAMSKDELLERLNKAIADADDDKERMHWACDILLLEYIADARISAIYDIDVEYVGNSKFWYA